MFLTMWDYLRKTNEDYEAYRPHVHHPEPFEGDGYSCSLIRIVLWIMSRWVKMFI